MLKQTTQRRYTRCGRGRYPLGKLSGGLIPAVVMVGLIVTTVHITAGGSALAAPLKNTNTPIHSGATPLDGISSQWISNYTWPDAVSGQRTYNYTLNGNSRNAVINYSPIEDQLPSLSISDNSYHPGTCRAHLNPYLPYSGSPTQGLCDPDLGLHIYVEAGIQKPIEILVDGLCINGWDYSIASGDTSFSFNIYAGSGEGITYKNPTHSSSWTDCYNDWLTAREGFIDDSKDPQEVDKLASYIGDSVLMSQMGWTFTDVFSFCHKGVGASQPGCTAIGSHTTPTESGSEIIVADGNNDGKIDGGSVEEVTLVIEGVEKTFYRYYARVFATGHDQTNDEGFGNRFKVYSKLHANDNGKQVLITMRDDVLGSNPDAFQSQRISLVNSVYTSNSNRVDTNKYYSLDPTPYWSADFLIAPPCRSNNLDTNEWDDWSGWMGYFEGKLWTGYDLAGAPLDQTDIAKLRAKANDPDIGIVAPIGLFDSDIGGELNPPEWTHRISVHERPMGSSDAWTPAYYPDEDSSLKQKEQSSSFRFDGYRNSLLHGNSNANPSVEVHSNQAELFWFFFKQGYEYKVSFENLHYRNLLQFLLPFHTSTRFQPPCQNGSKFVVEITKDCDLQVLDLDWKHPTDINSDHEYVHIEVGWEDAGGWHALAGKKTPNKISKDTDPESSTSLVRFADPDDAWDHPPPTWLSLINDVNSGLNVNQPYEVRIVGSYETETSSLVRFPTGDPNLESVTADGHGEFYLKKDTSDSNDPSRYYFESNPDRLPERGYCTWIEFEVDFDKHCNINITKLRWIRPKLTDPELRISLIETGGGSWIHSESRVSQPVLPPSKQELIPFKNDLNTNDITLKILLDDPPDPPKRLRLDTSYDIQLTGYYPSDTSPLIGLTDAGSDSNGDDKDKIDGEIAAKMTIYETRPGVRRIKFQHHDPQVTDGWSVEYQQPENPNDECGDPNDGIIVEITEDCDLRVIKSNWFRADTGNIPDNIHVEIGYLDSNNNWHTMPGLGYRDFDGNWLTSGPDGSKGRLVHQPNSSHDSWSLMRWVDTDPNAITFTSLIDNGQIGPDTGRYWAVMVVGFYDGTNLIKNPPQQPEVGESMQARGDGEFQLIQHSVGPPATHNLRSWDTVRWVNFPSGGVACPDTPQPQPDFEIEITDDCHIQVTRLDWDGKRPATEDFHVSLGWDNNGAWNEVAEERMAGIPVPPGTPQMFRLAVDTNNSSTETISTLRNNGSLQPGRKYELRITGYYDQPHPAQKKPFPTVNHIKAERRPQGKGIFEIVNFDPGEFKLWADPGDQFPPLASPDVGCLGIEPIPVFSVDIDQWCNITITRLFWKRSDGTNPRLEVSLMQGNNVVYDATKGQIINSLGGAGTGLLTFRDWDPNPPRSPLYNGLATTGVDYDLLLTGFYDNQTRQMARWLDPNIPGNYIAWTPNPADHASFRIHSDPLPNNQTGYYLMAGTTRIPSNPIKYCNDIPPCLTNPASCVSNCQVGATSFWTGPGTAVNPDKYNQSNHIWRTVSGPPATVPIPSEIYDNYVSPYQGWSHQVGSKSFVPRSAINYIPDPKNNPGQPIPETSHTRNTIEDNLKATFEYDWNDQHQWRRDSVWELFGQDYKPETTIRWISGPGTYGSGGIGSGWRNSYDYTVTGSHLLMKLNGSTTAIPTNGSPPNGLGFRPRSISNAPTSQYLEFETDSPWEFMTYGNDQTDSLVPYEWVFYWDITVTHTHQWLWHYDSDVADRWKHTGPYGHYEDRTRQVPDPDPDSLPGSTITETYEVKITDGTVNAVTSSPSYSTGAEWQSISSVAVRWNWTRSNRTPTIKRNTRVTGELSSCSWVLIIRPPDCVVRRRIWGSDAEVRFNPANSDPNDTDNNYEIFPAGKPDYTSRMELGNYNRFQLTPNANTRATLRPNIGPWHPTDNNNIGITALPPVAPETYWPMVPRTYNNLYPSIRDYHERLESLTPEWPGEYRLNWQVGWRSWAGNQWPVANINQVREYHSGRIGLNNSTHTWKGSEPTGLNLTCNNPVDGIWVYVSAKPPVCSVRYSIFEFTDPDTRIEIRLQNNNWVDLLVPGKSATTRNSPPWPSTINVGSINLLPYGPANYDLPQGYEAERPAGATIPPGIPNPIAGDAAGRRLATSPPTGAPLPQDLTRVDYPFEDNPVWLKIISDDRMATMPAPLGEYTFIWDLRVRRGIEWWSSADTGKVPGAWWDGNDTDERIQPKNPSPPLVNTSECKDIIRIVRIPFVKTFIGGMSAGGRYGLGDEFDSCKHGDWIPNPVAAQGAWGHSANTESLTTAIGSSVEHALRAQKGVGGIYSSSLTEQLDSHTNPLSVQSKALTYANTTAKSFGGEFGKPYTPSNISWRCLPNYWRIPDNANEGVSGLNLVGSTPQEGATTPNSIGASQNMLGPGDNVDIKDGAVLYIKGDLEITGDIRDGIEEDLRASIFVEGNVIISGNILNNINSGKKYFGFSDMGLIQIIALGNIEVQPQVTGIDATLVAYPVYDALTNHLDGGAIDLCASQTEDEVQHYGICASDDTTSTNRQLIINGALVAQRVYFNRLHETLNDRTTPSPAYPYGKEPIKATYGNTRASEVIVLMPEYHFVTPAASVFDDWIKRPQAIFDIPTSL